MRTIIILCAFVLTWTLASGQKSLSKQLISNGATTASSSSFKLNGSLGQIVIGGTEASSLALNQGYWSRLLESTTSIEQVEEEAILGFKLGSPYPNPSGGLVTLPLWLEKNQHISLQLFDTGGRLVRAEINRELAKGKNLIQMDLSAFPKANYFIIADNGKQRLSKSILIK